MLKATPGGAATRVKTCEASGVPRRSVVLIGPVAAGKSVVGELLAEALGRKFIELDEIAGDYYEEVGQSVDRLVERAQQVGFVIAHQWWQPARVQAVRRVVEQHAGEVISFGAGHSHFEDRSFYDEVQCLVDQCFVVLLLPHSDTETAVSILRARCLCERGRDYLYGTVDFIRDWVLSEQNRALADVLVVTDGRNPAEVAETIAALIAKE